MGRWAWSSDALDFDSDGWEDLYVANGMFTRARAPQDLDGFFWRQVVARSPLTRVTGTPYDDAWRAINQLLVHGSHASHQRNVLLRNDGQGGFDDVSGTVGPRPRPGRPLVRRARLRRGRRPRPGGDGRALGAAAAPVPQRLRARAAPPLAVRLAGSDEQSRRRRRTRHRRDRRASRGRRSCRPAPASSRSTRRSCSSASGASQRVVGADASSGRAARRRSSPTSPLNHRLRIEEGGEPRRRAFAARAPGAAAPRSATPRARRVRRARPGSTSPSRRPTSRCRTSTASTRSLAACAAGRRSSCSGRRGQPRRARRSGRWRAARRAAGGRRRRLAVALDPPADRPKVRAAAAGVRRCPSSSPATRSARATRSEPPSLHEPAGPAAADGVPPRRGRARSSRSYRGPHRRRGDPGATCRSDRGARRPSASRAPCPSRARSTPAPASATTFPYGRELLEQGLEARGRRRVRARGAGQTRRASTLYRLGTLLREERRAGEGARRPSSARWRCSPTSPRPATTWARCSRRAATCRRRSPGSGPRSPADARLPGRAQQPRLRAPPDRPATRRPASSTRRRSTLQPDFPEALNNLGLILGREGDLEPAERYFRQALAKRPDYGEAGNNLALVLVARGDGRRGDRACCAGLLEDEPGVRERVRHARQDLPGRGPAARGPAGARAPAADGTRATPGPRDRAGRPVAVRRGRPARVGML